MFTLISYSLTVQGKKCECHCVHMEFETAIAVRKLREDSRVSDLKEPVKFDTRMDLDRSNTRRVVYNAKGLGDTILHGLVKTIE